MTKKNTILKIVAIAMMLVLSLTVLAGCGNKEENTNTENTNVENTNAENTVAENTTTNEVVTTEPEETKKELSRGTWENDVYTNEFAELTFKLPEGWTSSTDEEIATLMQLSSDILEDESKYNTEIAKLKTVYDMMAKSADQTSNIQVLMEKTTYDIDTYAESLKAGLEQVQQLDYVIGDMTETTIGGNTYKVLTAKVEMTGVSMEQSYYIRTEGDYIIAIIVTSAGDMTVSEIMSNFQ